jgi:hypothetical protein
VLLACGYVCGPCSRFASTGSVLVTLSAIFRLRRPISQFLLYYRMFGLMVLCPLCLHLALELVDHRTAWRVYYARRGRSSDECGGSGGARTDRAAVTAGNNEYDSIAAAPRSEQLFWGVAVSSVDARVWVLYVLFPACYLSMCHELGRKY